MSSVKPSCAHCGLPHHFTECPFIDQPPPPEAAEGENRIGGTDWPKKMQEEQEAAEVEETAPFVCTECGMIECRGCPPTYAQMDDPISSPAPIYCPAGYEPVFEALRDALERCSNGKGNERHATEGEPFVAQSMLTDARLMNSPDGMVSQIRKKALESRSLDPFVARLEALDIMVYAAGLAYWYGEIERFEEREGREGREGQ